MAGEVTFTKREAEDRLYDFNFRTLTGNDSLTLSGTPTIAITRQDKVTEVTPLNAGVGTTNGGSAQFQISGGTNGELYKLVVEATDGTNTLEMTGWMEVEDVADTVALTANDSYVTLAEADVYFTKRNSAEWQDSEPAEKEAVLREATQWLDGRYDWIGHHPGSVTQLLGWPRNNVIDHEGRDLSGQVPSRVKDACCEAALLALDGALIPAEDRGGMISRAKIGPLEVTYDDQAPATRSFEFIDIILKGLTTRGTGDVEAKLMRA